MGAETRQARRTLVSYTGQQRGTAEVLAPRSAEEVATMLGQARRAGRRVVLRGAGLSFDGQAVGDDLALSLEGLTGLELDSEARRFTAGPGTTWGQVSSRLTPLGWTVPAAPTTSSATLGGTVGSSSLSRFSPLHGKEGKAVVALELVTPSGERVRCDREREPALFRAAVGGFGGVGAIVSATYAAHVVPAPTQVRSYVQRHDRFAGLERLLGPQALRDGRSRYAVISVTERAVRALVIASELCSGEAPRPMLPHRPYSPVRVPLELAVNRFHRISTLFWAFTHAVYMRGADTRPFVDDLEGYTYFMQGHLRAKQTADRFGLPFQVMQQTFIVPGDADLAPFTEHAVARLHRESLPPALVDVLWLPQDEPFCLSSTRASAGYALTFSFEGPFDAARARRVLAELAIDLQRIGGRVHLVKNVCAPPELLQQMYAEGLAEYAAVKRRVDPEGTLRSEFLARCFPSLYPPLAN